MGIFSDIILGGMTGKMTDGGIVGMPKFPKRDKDDPGVIKKLKTIFSDVDTEGKKAGYERAAEKYESVFESLKEKFGATKKSFAQQINGWEAKAENRASTLDGLEKYRASLEEKVNRKKEEASQRTGIPLPTLTKALGGSCFSPNILVSDIPSTLDILYKWRKGKFDAAEKQGYQEARELFESKIADLKNKLEALIDSSSQKIRNMKKAYLELFAAIADEKRKIADLELLLED